MANELLPDVLWVRIARVLPPKQRAQPKPKGGWPRVSDRAAPDSAAVPDGGPRNGQEPNGSRQTGREAPSRARFAHGIPLAVLVSAASPPRIARCGVEPKNRLGRYRWVVEWRLSWLNRFRRLMIRYERRADIHLAFL